MPLVRDWRQIAAAQAGLISLAQLKSAGVSHRAISYRVQSERWQRAAPSVICTTTGTLTNEQRLWLGTLHAGEGAMIGGIQACERAGLKNWSRDEIVVLVPLALAPRSLDGFSFVRCRRDMTGWLSAREGVPTCRVEPAALLWASRQRHPRTAEGLLAAVVQQRCTTAAALLERLESMPRLPQAARFRACLREIGGGSQSVAELDVIRMCKRFGLPRPDRQVKRRDATGKPRWTDCEWRLPGGGVLVLEVDGAFHLSVESWEDDIGRQRSITAPGRMVVRATARELRDCPEVVAADLKRLGLAV